MAVIQLHGMDDKVCPYEGGESVTGHTFLNVEDSINSWAVYNQCAETPNTTTTSEGNTRIRYSGCADGVDVVHYGFPGVGHNVPKTVEGGLMALIWSHFEAIK